MIHVYPRYFTPLRAFVPVAVVLVVGSQAYAVPNHGNDARRVSVLSMGAELQIMMREPFLDVFPVLGFRGWYPEDVIKRSVRLYMPRTYRELVERFEVIGLHYTEPRFFTAKQIKWLSDAILEGGRGFAFYGHGAQFYPWLDTTVAGVSPVEEMEHFEEKRVVWIRILKPENPLIASLAWSEMGKHGCFVGAQGVKAKIGAKVLAEKTPVDYGMGTPFLTWWEVGAGRCLAITPYYASVEVGSNPFTSWEFYPDFVRNYHLYLGGREIPPDPVVLHQITLTLEECNIMRGMLISLTEFISGLGGDPEPLYDRLDRAEEQLEEVYDRYLAYEFEESLSIAQDLLVDVKGSVVFAVELKNGTIFWLCLIEWIVLTGTAVLSGTVVWILMVRRRLYREAEITKLGGHDIPGWT